MDVFCGGLLCKRLSSSNIWGVKVDCFYAFNTFEVFVPFVVGGTIIKFHICLVMENSNCVVVVW